MNREKKFEVVYVCGFCGSVTLDEIPVALGLKRVSGCERCMVSTIARPGAKVKYGGYERSDSMVFTDNHLSRGETYTLRNVNQWQHACSVTLTETGNLSFNIQTFTPVDYEQTAYHQLRLKLRELGAKFKGDIGRLDLFGGKPVVYEGWTLDLCGLIVAHNSDKIGLYDFIGEEDADVGNDLRYLEDRHAKRSQSF
jgi:hypothetical protein